MPSPSSNGSAPRYAPEDPTLPKPWKGLVDGNTGFLYYWNPETNVTQYEKPSKEKERFPGPPPLPPSTAVKLATVSSSVHRGGDDDGRSRRYQRQDGTGHGHGYGSLSSRTTVRDHRLSDAGGGLSVEAYRRQHEITINGDDVPPPYMTFESTGFPSEILKEVHRAGFAAPTPIQAQSWPIALQSRDVVAIAKTGSGKTLGYLIPGFIHLKRVNTNPRSGPAVLVLAPTRELATQIQDEADKFGRSSKISCTCVYGGAPKGPQLRALDRGVDVVVATPGRLNDILEMRRINLRQVMYLVLDEADRMLDMGFEPQIRKIVKEIPHRRQTLMFTATWPKEVRKIAADLLVHPVQVNIGSIDELVANKAITQYVEVIKPSEKQRRLEQILRSQDPGSKVIIFCSTKRMCDQLTRTVSRQFGAAAIHGDKNQSERDRVLGHFRTGRCPILVATDVAARGLDIKDIRVVINFDFPTGVEDYVHRIGRTGRAGATGISYTFFSDQDSKYAFDLVKVLEGAGQRVPPELRDMVSRGGYGGRSRRWGSGARDRDRSNGTGRSSDISYGGRGGRGPLPLGRSDIDRGRSDIDRAVRRSDRDSRDRYDRDRGYQDRHEAEAGRGREDVKAISKGRVHNSRSKSRSLSPSPKRGRDGPGQSRSRSRSPGHDQGLRRDWNLKSATNRQRKSSPASYDDGEIRDDRLEISPSSRRRSRSPILLRDDRRLDRSRSPRKISRSRSPVHHSPNLRKRSRSPVDCSLSPRKRCRSPIGRSPIRAVDNGRSDGSPSRKKARAEPDTYNEKPGGSVSPGEWRSGSPDYPDGDEGPPIDKPVRSQLPPYDGEEEEEGMITPDEEEGMIHPDEDSNSIR